MSQWIDSDILDTDTGPWCREAPLLAYVDRARFPTLAPPQLERRALSPIQRTASLVAMKRVDPCDWEAELDRWKVKYGVDDEIPVTIGDARSLRQTDGSQCAWKYGRRESVHELESLPEIVCKSSECTPTGIVDRTQNLVRAPQNTVILDDAPLSLGHHLTENLLVAASQKVMTLTEDTDEFQGKIGDCEAIGSEDACRARETPQVPEEIESPVSDDAILASGSGEDTKSDESESNDSASTPEDVGARLYYELRRVSVAQIQEGDLKTVQLMLSKNQKDALLKLLAQSRQTEDESLAAILRKLEEAGTPPTPLTAEADLNARSIVACPTKKLFLCPQPVDVPCNTPFRTRQMSLGENEAADASCPEKSCLSLANLRDPQPQIPTARRKSLTRRSVVRESESRCGRRQSQVVDMGTLPGKELAAMLERDAWNVQRNAAQSVAVCRSHSSTTGKEKMQDLDDMINDPCEDFGEDGKEKLTHKNEVRALHPSVVVHDIHANLQVSAMKLAYSSLDTCDTAGFASAPQALRDFLHDILHQRAKHKIDANECAIANDALTNSPAWNHLASRGSILAPDFTEISQLITTMKCFASARYAETTFYLLLLGEVPRFLPSSTPVDMIQLLRLMARLRLREQETAEMLCNALMEKMMKEDGDAATAIPRRLVVKCGNALSELDIRQPRFVDFFLQFVHSMLDTLDVVLMSQWSPLFVVNYCTDAVRRAVLKRMAVVCAGIHSSEGENTPCVRNVALMVTALRKEHAFVCSLSHAAIEYFDEVDACARTHPLAGIFNADPALAKHFSMEHSDWFSSALHRDVSACLTYMGVIHKNGVLQGPYVLDIVATAPKRSVLYECNSTESFYSNTQSYTAARRMRHALIRKQAEISNVGVVLVDSYAWYQMSQAQKLLFLLEKQGINQSPV